MPAATEEAGTEFAHDLAAYHVAHATERAECERLLRLAAARLPEASRWSVLTRAAFSSSRFRGGATAAMILLDRTRASEAALLDARSQRPEGTETPDGLMHAWAIYQGADSLTEAFRAGSTLLEGSGLAAIVGHRLCSMAALVERPPLPLEAGPMAADGLGAVWSDLQGRPLPESNVAWLRRALRERFDGLGRTSPEAPHRMQYYLFQLTAAAGGDIPRLLELKSAEEVDAYAATLSDFDMEKCRDAFSVLSLGG